MQFQQLSVGQRFYKTIGGMIFKFEKKSGSSAYTLNPATNEYEKMPGFARNSLRFGKTVEVDAVRPR